MNHRKTLLSFSINLRGLLAAVAFVSGIVIASPAFALPSLQLGPGSSSDWTYFDGDQTWYYNGTQPFTLNAYANATQAEGGHGDYAWETKPDTDRYAYLVASVVPKLGDMGDILDISVSGTTQITSGYGRPPVEDPNSLSPHGIYDTYFEIFEFQFGDPIVDISDQQPGQTGTGKGYNEAFSTNWSDSTTDQLITGVHFDLFTVAGGRYQPPVEKNIDLVYAFAPFSHDAQSSLLGEPPSSIPEPSVLALFGISLLGLGVSRRRRKEKA